MLANYTRSAQALSDLLQRDGVEDKEVLKAFIDKIEPINKFGEKTILKSKLWDEYREIQKQFSRNKKLKFEDEKTRRKKVIDLIRKKWQLQRDKTMKNKTISRQEKQKIYKLIKEGREKELAAARDQFKAERDQIFSENKKQSFKDFLIERSLSGDKEALEALRKTKPKEIKSGENTLAAVNKKENNQIFSFEDKLVNKDGTVTYKINEDSKVIDKGEHLKIDIKDNNSNEILTILKMAIAKYGNELNITGSDEFKREILKTVQEHNLEVTFKDQQMQQVNRVQKESQELQNVKNHIRIAAEKELAAVLEEREELEANKIKDPKEKAKALKEKDLNINRLYKLYMKTTTNATIYPGDLKKIGFEDKQIDRMETYGVEIKVDGFIKDSTNTPGLKAMNEKILINLEKKIETTTDPKKLESAKNALERYKKFLYVFNETDKIEDMTLSYYDNRKMDVEDFTKRFNMSVSKLDKEAQAIKLDDKVNAKEIIEATKNIKLSNVQKNKVKFAIDKAKRAEAEKKAINL